MPTPESTLAEPTSLAAVTCNLTPVTYLPVRHHSPACARLVQRLFARLSPAHVLIEGPSDFNDRLAELALPHQLPIAIYSFVRDESGRRSGAYYPFCVHSPEWAAIRCAVDTGVPFSFIDLPWRAMMSGRADDSAESERYSDGALRRSALVDAVCKRLEVESFDDAWDTLFEIDPSPDPDDLLVRLDMFCRALRTADEEAGCINPSDLARESYMRASIARIRAAADGPILVITGGYHTSALRDWLGAPDDAVPHEAATPSESFTADIALTPYSEARLDALTGYASGMPSPGFYRAIWENEEPLPIAVGALRARKQNVSAADLIAAQIMARGLADLRGHQRVWRRDLLDGATSALVKEAIGDDTHPLVAALLDAFRGGARGRLAEGTRRPPLALEIEAALSNTNLTPEPVARTVEFSLEATGDRQKSRLLHRLASLSIPGIARTGGADFTVRDDLVRPRERWQLHWTPEFDGAIIEAALYGATIEAASLARLSERIGRAERDAEAAALILLDAALMGLDAVTAEVAARLTELVRAESEFARLARALGHLLYLFRFDDALGARGGPVYGQLLDEAFARGTWLLASVGDGSPETIDGVARLVDVLRRCRERLDDTALRDVLRRVADDSARAPALRGAAAGALWSLGDAGDETILELVGAFAKPEQLGDFLSGVFTLAREMARNGSELLLRLDRLLLGFDDDDFLAALPLLRLAFSYFAPREKHQMARRLLEAVGDDTAPLPALAVDANAAARALALESALYAQMARYGVIEC